MMTSLGTMQFKDRLAQAERFRHCCGRSWSVVSFTFISGHVDCFSQDKCSLMSGCGRGHEPAQNCWRYRCRAVAISFGSGQVRSVWVNTLLGGQTTEFHMYEYLPFLPIASYNTGFSFLIVCYSLTSFTNRSLQDCNCLLGRLESWRLRWDSSLHCLQPSHKFQHVICVLEGCAWASTKQRH